MQNSSEQTLIREKKKKSSKSFDYSIKKKLKAFNAVDSPRIFADFSSSALFWIFVLFIYVSQNNSKYQTLQHTFTTFFVTIKGQHKTENSFSVLLYLKNSMVHFFFFHYRKKLKNTTV